MNKQRNDQRQRPFSEELEIIELDDRMDMTIDPFVGFGLNSQAPNNNCGNIGCC